MSQPRQVASAPVGIVLAGGRSTRLGPLAAGVGGKASVTLGGRTLLASVVAALEEHVGRIVVVTARQGGVDPAPQPAYGLEGTSHVGIDIIHDTVSEGGPLGALADALGHVGAAWGASAGDEAVRVKRLRDIEAVVVSCDVPLVRPGVVGLLLERLRSSGARWVVPQVHGHPQVLVSAVRGDLLPGIESHLAAGRRDLRGLLDAVARADPAAVCRLDADALIAVDPRLDSFRDVDTPDDLAAVAARLGTCAPGRGPGWSGGCDGDVPVPPEEDDA